MMENNLKPRDTLISNTTRVSFPVSRWFKLSFRWLKHTTKRATLRFKTLKCPSRCKAEYFLVEQLMSYTWWCECGYWYDQLPGDVHHHPDSSLLIVKVRIKIWMHMWAKILRHRHEQIKVSQANSTNTNLYLYYQVRSKKGKKNM